MTTTYNSKISTGQVSLARLTLLFPSMNAMIIEALETITTNTQFIRVIYHY